MKGFVNSIADFMTKRGYMDYAFHCYNSMAGTGLMMALSKLLGPLQAPPVVLCIGSDLTIGDSLGPLTGTLLRRRGLPGYVYGSLKAPVTAKEVKYLGEFLKKTHPKSKIIAIDAAVGDESEIGLIKVSDVALRPGSGANKRLGKVGDVSVLGIVTKKTDFSYAMLNLTRLNTVYSMADTITRAVEALFTKETSQIQRAI